MTNMPPNLTSKLRTDIVQAPSAIKAASGITLFGKKNSQYHLYHGRRCNRELRC
ncbi:hypothetical protein FAM18126_00245 [Lacticaseibacillus paracasei]|nr:hypothetical protein FAM18126_00245 [Lacticaseibacillus paracasei]